MTFYLLLVSDIMRLLLNLTNIYQELSVFLAFVLWLNIAVKKAPHEEFIAVGEAEIKKIRNIETIKYKIVSPLFLEAMKVE